MAGTLKSVNIAGIRLHPDSETDVSIFLGGYNNENKVTGDGKLYTVKTRVAGKLDTIDVILDDSRKKTLKKLQEVMDSTDNNFPIFITDVEGTTYQGTGTIEGSLEYSTMTGKVSISLMSASFKMV